MDAIHSGGIGHAENVITTRIQDGSPLGEAKRKLDAVDEDRLAVVDPNDKFGGLSNEAVTSELLTRLARELEQ